MKGEGRIEDPHNIPPRRFALKVEKKNEAVYFCSIGVHDDCSTNAKLAVVVLVFVAPSSMRKRCELVTSESMDRISFKCPIMTPEKRTLRQIWVIYIPYN
jgi:hypothetical protein